MIKKIIEHIKSNAWFYTFLAFILSLLMTVKQEKETIGGLIAKMSSDVFNIVVIAILFFGVIISFIRWNTQLLRNKLRKAEEKAQQYDELAKHVELPKAVDKAITVEKNPDWGILHPYNDIIQNRKDDKFPYLQFYMRVINRTYHYFEPDELVIGCSFDTHKLEDRWNSKIEEKETNIEIDDLRECEDVTIRVRFPIKERYANLRKWKLDGTVTYKLKGSVIEANKQYMRPEIGIHIEYELPEEQIMKLKEEVEKALVDEK